MVFSYTFSYKHFYVHLFFILHQLEKAYILNVIRIRLACNIIIKKTPLRMKNLKTSYIPNMFFSGQYFKVGKTVSNLHAVVMRLKKIKTMLLLTVVNPFVWVV